MTRKLHSWDSSVKDVTGKKFDSRLDKLKYYYKTEKNLELKKMFLVEIVKEVEKLSKNGPMNNSLKEISND